MYRGGNETWEKRNNGSNRTEKSWKNQKIGEKEKNIRPGEYWKQDKIKEKLEKSPPPKKKKRKISWKPSSEAEISSKGLIPCQSLQRTRNIS